MYVSTDTAVYQFPVHQCHRYVLCTECERDPLCHYDLQQNRCTTVDDRSVHQTNIFLFRQSMHVFSFSISNPKVAMARLQPDSWCKKSVQRPSKSIVFIEHF